MSKQPKLRKGRSWWRIPVALVILAVFLSPFYILLSVAFRSPQDLSSYWIFPSELHLENFQNAIEEGDILLSIFNSLVITVGAVDGEMRVADFTSSGVYQGVYRPDVFAPGVAVRGVDAGGTYALMTGTSVSAPYVAGACCLLHERYKALTPREAKRMIVASSVVRDGVRVFVL